ncbi:MAG: HAD family hydrolase [Chloroflexi bacterium]|nr:HAD family hydrolase [Chloroflexota bacterium]MBP8054938.1 HAD family hydrolase [Chloroflexota bacterium]
MLKAILFDLDDTLLGNKMDSFLPQYFRLLGQYAAALFDKDRFLPDMLFSTKVMMSNTDPAHTNREIFWQAFQQRTGLDPAELEPFFDRFYREQFPALQAVCEPIPGAVELVEWALAQNMPVVIATNPMFPRVAIEERLRWANLPVMQYPFALVTTYECMHATKPNQAYYEEILAHIGMDAPNCLMVGDDWKNDMEPALALGMSTFWITDGTGEGDVTQVMGYGSLADLATRLYAGWLKD